MLPQIWDKTITHLTHVCPLPAAGAGLAPRNTHFARGVSINVANDGTPHICFGTSGGEVYALELSEADGKFKSAPVALPKHHKSPITALGSAYHSRQVRLGLVHIGCRFRRISLMSSWQPRLMLGLHPWTS